MGLHSSNWCGKMKTKIIISYDDFSYARRLSAWESSNTCLLIVKARWGALTELIRR